MALADVFDALTTKRPYKAAIQPEAAFELIKSSSGTLFDPALVSIFVEKLEDFRNVLRITDKSGGD
jgi:putative two-component system response regulator